MGSIGLPLKLSACILIFLILENFCVTCDNHWCYDLPSCGPSTWGPIGSCSGTRQSPINIDSKTVISDSSFGTIYFTNYEDRNIAKKIKNTGYQLRIDFEAKATISSDGFSELYYLHQCHFHWSTEKSNGAEHTIDGKRYAMEMHLVHTKNNMSIEEASKQSDGLVILSFLIKTTQKNNQVTAWNTLAKFLKKIPEKGDSWDLNGEFCMGGLLKTADVSHYFHYQGSLTSPPCAEAVIWIIFPDVLEIPYLLLEQFTNELYFTTIEEDRLMQNNVRPLQQLNDRKVYYYTEHKSLFTCMGYCFAKLFKKDFKFS